MNKYVIFENTVYNKRLERKLYSYCLHRQISLIRFLPFYMLCSILNFFGIFRRKKYLEARYGFLSQVKGLNIRLKDFFTKNRKKFFLPPGGGEVLCVLSDAPEEVMSAFGLICGTEVIANDYDTSSRKFTEYRKAAEMIPDGEEYEAVGTSFCPIMKKAAAKTYIYSKRSFKTKGGCIAASVIHYVMAYLAMITVSVGVGGACLWWAAAAYKNKDMLFKSYFDVPLIVVLNILPVVVLTLLAYFLFNNTAAAVFFSSAVAMVLALVNHFKLLFRNDPFLVPDFGLIMEARTMTEKYEITVGRSMIVAAAALILATVVCALLFRCKTKNFRVRIAILAAITVISAVGVEKLYLSGDIYRQAANPAIEDPLSDTENFRFRGFIYPFIYSINRLEHEPDGYDKKEAASILAQYTDDTIPEDRRVNVIGVMLEAFADFSKFDEIDFVKDPYTKFKAICDESYSGTLITDIFAGGTIRTERSFITAAADEFAFRKPSNSYAWYFRDQGYTVEGSHPCYDWFYNRVNINKNLGFQNYYFDDDTYMDLNGGNRLAFNYIVLPNIVKLMNEANARGEDYFSFSVTYQGHGPYENNFAYFGDEYVQQGDYSDYSYYVMNNYLLTIDSVSQSVYNMLDSVRDSSEPVVVIMFGDHMPWLGNGNSVYQEFGINLDLSTDDGFCNYYSTPYFIWANSKAKETLNCDFIGDGPTIGSYFLMNEFFRLADYGGNQYTKFTADIEKELHVIHSSGVCFDSEGNICRTLTPEQQETVSRYKNVEYYYLHNFKK